jgi:hypothetical protein
MTCNRHPWRKAAAALIVLFPAAATASVARVDFAVGNVIAVSADGRTRALERGAEIDVGDTVNTQQGRAQLRFLDGAYMSLQPDTAFKIEQFRFVEKGQGGDNIVMSLLKGGMRTITGLIGRANRRNYKFRTEVATIGIRGTEYSVRYTNSIEVFCAEGAISVENEAGTLPLNSGEGAQVLSADAAPIKTDEPPVLLPQPTTLRLDEPVNPIQVVMPPVAVPVGKFTGAWAAAQLANVAAATGVTIEQDGTGALVAFGGNLSSTSAAVIDGSNGISWGRWTNGIVGGTGSFAGVDTGSAPLHWVAGLPTANMPTGTASYAMIGATPPSCSPLCTSAVLDRSSLSVDFSNATVNLDIALRVDGLVYSPTTSSGIPLIITGSSFTGSGAMGSGGTTLSAAGFFSGDAAARAGLAYELKILTQQSVNGAIAYQKQ